MAAEYHDLWIKDINQIADADAEPVSDLSNAFHCTFITPLSQQDQVENLC